MAITASLTRQVATALVAAVPAMLLAGCTSADCLWFQATYDVTVSFQVAAPDEATVQSFVDSVEAEPEWNATLGSFTNTSSGWAAVIAVQGPGMLASQSQGGEIDLNFTSGSSSTSSFMRLRAHSPTSSTSGAAMDALVAEIGNDASWLQGKLAASFGTVKVTESGHSSGQGGCCGPACD